MNEGHIASSARPNIAVDDYEKHFAEVHVPHSTALQSELGEAGAPYFLGPLARLRFNHERLFPQARRLTDELFPDGPTENRFHSILARSIEVIHSLAEAISIIKSYRTLKRPFVEYSPRTAFGCAATEAPRGMIYHSYRIDDAGEVVHSKIVPPTSQNQKQIELDLVGFLPSLIQQSDDRVAAECEKLIRTYDPCISCSTHFLRLTMERQ